VLADADLLLNKRVSELAVQASWNLAAGASVTASLACVPTWHEDFRNDVNKIDVPTLVIYGDADRILPITAAGLRTAKLIKGARLSVTKDGPLHNLDTRGRSENSIGKFSWESYGSACSLGSCREKLSRNKLSFVTKRSGALSPRKEIGVPRCTIGFVGR